MSVRQRLEARRRENARDGFQGVPLEGVEQPRLRAEDALRGLALTAVIAIVGIAMGIFTENQIAGRGTSYYVLAAGLGIALTALAYYKIELVMVIFMAVGWIAVGSAPDVASSAYNAGTGRSLGLSQIGMAFLLFVWLLRAAVKGEFSFARLSVNRLLFVYLGFCILSAAQGCIFWDQKVYQYVSHSGIVNGGKTPILVSAFEIGIRFLSMVAFWLFANNMRDPAWVRRASWLLLLPGALVFLLHFVPVPLPLNAYSVLLESALACTLFAWLLEPRAPGVPARRGLRFWAWLLLGAVIYQMFFLNMKWLSGWFTLFVGLYWVAFLRSRRLFVALVVGGLILYVAGYAFLQATVIHKIQTSGDTARFTMAYGAYRFALVAPLGIGPTNWRMYILYYGTPDRWNVPPFSTPHSFFSQTLAELGFGGFVLTVLFLLTAVVMTARFYFRMPPGAPRTFVLGMAGFWVGICASSGVGDYLIPTYYNGAVNTMSTTIYVWIALGLAVANARLYGLVGENKEIKPEEAAPSVEAATYYPRRLGGGPAPSPLGARTSYYPRRMGRDRDPE